MIVEWEMESKVQWLLGGRCRVPLAVRNVHRPQGGAEIRRALGRSRSALAGRLCECRLRRGAGGPGAGAPAARVRQGVRAPVNQSPVHTVVEKGLITRDPCESVKLPPIDDDTEDDQDKVFLTERQFALLRSCMHVADRDFLTVAVGTGLRWGELTDGRSDGLRAVTGQRPPVLGCRTGAAPRHGRRCTSTVNLVVRSTRVPIAELSLPRMRSPSANDKKRLDAAPAPPSAACGRRRTPRSSSPAAPGVHLGRAHPRAQRLLEPIPSFTATDDIAAHYESYCSRTSPTSRTARSRSSWGYRCDLLDMAPSSRTGASGQAGVIHSASPG